MDDSPSKRQERCDTDKEDRISELPDSILCHILSFLTTLTCVRTSCLSRRWRYLCTSVPSLDFDYLDYALKLRSRDPANKSELFDNFVNTVFIRSTNPCIERFRLHLSLSHANITTSYVNSWILAACTRYMKELDIVAIFVGINIPQIIFDSEKLVSFKLGSCIALNVPEFVNLPSLRVLHLKHQSCPSFSYINKIISGCPVLEDLAIYVSRNLNDIQTLSILSSSLKRFELRNRCYDTYTVTLNAPQLKIFHLTDVFFLKPQIEINNFSSIKKAIFDVAYCGSESSRKRFFNLFVTPAGNTFKMHHWVNLTQLVLRYCVAHLNTLPIILKCFPKLEELELECQKCNHTIACENLKKEKSDIYCLKHSLKIFQLRSFEGKEAEMLTIEFFTKNAQVLKDIRISSVKELEGEVLKKLLMFPRCTQTYQYAVFS